MPGRAISIQEDFQFTAAVDERGWRITTAVTITGHQAIDGTGPDMNDQVFSSRQYPKFFYMLHRNVRHQITESIDILNLPDQRLAVPNRIGYRS